MWVNLTELDKRVPTTLFFVLKRDLWSTSKCDLGQTFPNVTTGRLMSSNYKCCRGFQEAKFLKKQRYQLRVLLFTIPVWPFSKWQHNEGNHAASCRTGRVPGHWKPPCWLCFNIEIHLSDFETCNPGNLTSSSSLLYIPHTFHYIWFSSVWKTDSLTSSSPASLLRPSLISLHLVAYIILHGSNDHNHLWSYGVISHH